MTREQRRQSIGVVSTEGALKCISRNFPLNKARLVGIEKAPCKLTHGLSSNSI